jgi:hypothetical protein
MIDSNGKYRHDSEIVVHKTEIYEITIAIFFKISKIISIGLLFKVLLKLKKKNKTEVITLQFAEMFVH